MPTSEMRWRRCRYGAEFDKTADAIQKFTDNQLLLELVRRGYDLTSTQGVDNITAEIVKIGRKFLFFH